MNLWQRSNEHFHWIQERGCAFLAILYKMYQMFDLDKSFNLTVNDWYHIFLSRGVIIGGVIQWKRLETLFNIDVRPLIYDDDSKIHYCLKNITEDSVISVDGLDEVGYQSHFLAVEKFENNTLTAFDPFYNITENVMKRYKRKDSLYESVFTMINFRKVD